MPKQRYRNADEDRHNRGLGDVLAWKLGLPPPREALAAAAPENDPGNLDRLRAALTPAERAALDQPAPVVANDGAALREAAQPALTWIGHATFLVQLGGRSLLTDPILSERIAVVKRLRPPGLSWEALPRIDVVTVSHNHRDHMDAPTLRRLGPEVTYVVPQGQGAWFRREGLTKVVELEWWQGTEVCGLQVTLVPAWHWSRRGLWDTNEALWGGYVVSAGGQSVYHSGDTAYFPGFAEIGARLGALDAAMLPIGAYEPRWFMKPQHMNPADAVQAFVDLGAWRLVAMHWGTFKLTDEPQGEPPVLMRALWRQRGLAAERLAIPAIGETVGL